MQIKSVIAQIFLYYNIYEEFYPEEMMYNKTVFCRIYNNFEFLLYKIVYRRLSFIEYVIVFNLYYMK